MKFKKMLALHNEFEVLYATYAVEILDRFKLNGIRRLIRPHVESYTELNNEYYKEHGSKPDKFGVSKLPPEKSEDYKNKVGKILDEEIDITLPKIPIKTLENIKALNTFQAGQSFDFPEIFDLVEE